MPAADSESVKESLELEKVVNCLSCGLCFLLLAPQDSRLYGVISPFPELSTGFNRQLQIFHMLRDGAFETEMAIKVAEMLHTGAVHGCKKRSDPPVKHGFYGSPKTAVHEGSKTEKHGW